VAGRPSRDLSPLRNGVITLASALNFTLVADAAPELARGFLIALGVTLVGVIGALCLGFAGAVLRMSRARAARGVATAFTEFFRNTPPLVQMYFLFFGLPALAVLGPVLRPSAIIAGTLALVLHQGAINVEIMRAGLQAVTEGQREAAAALGLGHVDQLRFVLLPQAFRISLPALGNNAISLFKNTSLLSAIGVPDLVGVANDRIATYLVSAEFYLTIGIVYWVSVGIFGALVRALECRLAPAR
jgi:His/Glu/Gln/Arg/opine family amino acid ABC transporter permease subunit